MLVKQRHEKINQEEKIKAVFEIRCASLEGFMPDVDACTCCGALESDAMYLDVMNGILKCGDCIGKEENLPLAEEITGTATILLPLDKAVLETIRYILLCPPKRIFSFSINESDVQQLSSVAEKYLLNHIGKGFGSLEFYREIKYIKVNETIK